MRRNEASNIRHQDTGFYEASNIRHQDDAQYEGFILIRGSNKNEEPE